MPAVKKFIGYLWIIGMGLSLSVIGAFSASAYTEPFVENLDLTPEQAQTFKDLRSRFRQELVQIQKKIVLCRLELRTLTPEEYKGEKGEEFRRQTQSLLLKVRERSLFYQQEALRILTPEQRGKLPPETDLGFHWGRMFRGGGPGMGRGMGRGMGPGMRGPEHGPHGPMNSD